MVSCLVLCRQKMPCAFAFDLANAGSNRLARMPMIATATSSSISVNAQYKPTDRFDLLAEAGARARILLELRLAWVYRTVLYLRYTAFHVKAILALALAHWQRPSGPSEEMPVYTPTSN